MMTSPHDLPIEGGSTIERRTPPPDGPVEFHHRDFGRMYDRLSDTNGMSRDEIRAYDLGLQRGLQLSMSQIVDPLTGLYTRLYRIATIESHREWVREDPSRHAFLVRVDVTNFKSVNDMLGHARGDQVLALFAGLVLAELQREHDVLGFRPGGDEFEYVCRGRSEEKANAAARMAVARVNEVVAGDADLQTLPPGRNGYVVGTGIDIGLIRIRPDHTAAEILQAADELVHAGKRARLTARTEVGQSSAA